MVSQPNKGKANLKLVKEQAAMAIMDDPNTDSPESPEDEAIVVSVDTELSQFDWDSLTNLVVQNLQNHMVEFVNNSKLIKSVDPTDLKNQTELALKDTDYERLLEQAEAFKKQATEIRNGIYNQLEADAKSGIENDPAVIKKVDSLREAIKQGINYLKTVNSTIEIDTPPGYKKTGASTGAGSTGVRRIRGFDFFVNGIKYENSTSLAKSMAIDIEKVQQAFFSAQGGDDSKQWSNEVTFELSGVNVTARKSPPAS